MKPLHGLHEELSPMAPLGTTVIIYGTRGGGGAVRGVDIGVCPKYDFIIMFYNTLRDRSLFMAGGGEEKVGLPTS